jgi:hypothetical protein
MTSATNAATKDKNPDSFTVGTTHIQYHRHWLSIPLYLPAFPPDSRKPTHNITPRTQLPCPADMSGRILCIASASRIALPLRFSPADLDW